MKLSLGRKIVLLIILIAVLLSGTCIFVSGAVNRSTMDKEYIITADSMAATVAVTVDGDKMKIITDKVMELYRSSSTEEQCAALMQDETYIEMQTALRKIQDVSEADCVYTVYICPDEKTAVYIVDAAYEEIIPPAYSEPLEEFCYPYLDDLSEGLPAFISNTAEYGWLATAGAPIYDSHGEIVCFAAVDLSMNDVLSKENRFLFILAAILLALTAIICIVAIAYVKKNIVKPINLLSETARQYGQNQSNTTHHEFSTLKIHTGDELEILLSSMVQMEKDIDSYIKNLTQTKAQLHSARQHADNMQELAHMDSLTGIRNRLAYDKAIIRLDSEIQNGFDKFGIAMVDLNFLKSINDTYGHECGNTAIIALSQLICETFVYSPVFRIGGDEFAVILKNNDYLNIASLTQEFNQKLEKFAEDDTLQPWEKISAAFGYALFDSTADQCAEDVFTAIPF